MMPQLLARIAAARLPPADSWIGVLGVNPLMYSTLRPLSTVFTISALAIASVAAAIVLNKLKTTAKDFFINFYLR
jgi:hypothetical protein